jgi:amino acid transporter
MLTIGANTIFAGLPRIMGVMADEGYLPKRLTNVSSRSVLANGSLLLTAAPAVLIVVFSGSSHALIVAAGFENRI